MTLEQLQIEITRQIVARREVRLPCNHAFISQQVWVALGYPTEYAGVDIVSTVFLAPTQVLVT